jgi:hyaluronoglucosaminidase
LTDSQEVEGSAGEPFVHRGVVEGYYGNAWTHADRLFVLERMGHWRMNRYVYAPKDDPLHRERWREPYPAEAMRDFGELVAKGADAGVDVGFAIAPGLSIEYASRDDRRRLHDKLASFRDLGARFLCLALDDVPSELVHDLDKGAFRSLGEAHADLTAEVAAALGSALTLWLVPTDYAGIESSAYLETLGAALPPEVEVGWTGRTVVSPTITCEEAAPRAAALRRRLLLWDNYPVNDGPMRRTLHLGPYLGRDPALAEHVSGILLNPMELARASSLALRTAAAYLCGPREYDPEAAWQEAIAELAPGAAAPLADFASAHRFSALAPDDRDRELEAAIASLREVYEQDLAVEDALQHCRALLVRRLAAADRLRAALDDARLLEELEPWLAAHQRECRAMDAALDLLECLAGDADRLDRALAFFRLEGRLTRLPTPLQISFGPRRALYPQLVDVSGDAAGFGEDPVLFVDRSLSDELVRFAEARALAELQR